MRPLLLLLAFLALVGCATIRDHRQLSQPQNQMITASVGSSLFRLTRKSDLPNAYGGRDIYGGKVDRGYAEVKLAGVRGDRYVDLIVVDENRESAETTMDRYGRRSSVAVSQTVNLGGGGAGGIAVTVDAMTEREFVLAGVKVTFVEVRRSSVVYTVTDTLATR